MIKTLQPSAPLHQINMDAEPVHNVLAIINRDISAHINVKQLANQSGTNECSLKKAFRKVLNISIYQYLLQRRMDRAEQLLKETNEKEKDIAMECGFCSLAGFVTSFKKYYGVTPGQVRKQL